MLDPKASWALNHLEEFPKEINKCSYNDLLKIPGIGVTSAKRIISSRKYFRIDFKDLKKMGIVLKRAKYFITCNNKYFTDTEFFKRKIIEKSLILEDPVKNNSQLEQLTLFQWKKVIMSTYMTMTLSLY